MLNHTYTSVKNANLVDCGKKQHMPSQPTPLLKENFLGEFRTELDKKKVLAALGIATNLSLEWENIKGDIGRNGDLMKELDSRTTYTTKIGDFKNSVISIVKGIEQLETFVGGGQEGEEEQNNRLTELETLTQKTIADLDDLKDYLTNTVDVNIEQLQTDLTAITESVTNITNLIKVSNKEGNAIQLIGDEDVAEDETPGLYVPDLSPKVNETSEKVEALETEVTDIKESLGDFVTKEDLGNDFDFVNQEVFNQHVLDVSKDLDTITNKLQNTVDSATYNSDKQQLANDLATQITTDTVVTETLDLSGNIVAVQDDTLKVNSEYLVKSSEVTNIKVMSQTDYDNLATKEDNTYYYTYDSGISYVTQLELNQKLKEIQDRIDELTLLINNLDTRITEAHPEPSQNE